MTISIRPLSDVLSISGSDRGETFLKISFRMAFDLQKGEKEIRSEVNCHFFRVEGVLKGCLSATDSLYDHSDLSLPPRVRGALITFPNPLVIECINNRPKSWLDEPHRNNWLIAGFIRSLGKEDQTTHRFSVLFDSNDRFSSLSINRF